MEDQTTSMAVLDEADRDDRVAFDLEHMKKLEALSHSPESDFD